MIEKSPLDSITGHGADKRLGLVSSDCKQGGEGDLFVPGDVAPGPRYKRVADLLRPVARFAGDEGRG